MRTRFFSLLVLLLTCRIALAAKPTPPPKTVATATPAPTVSKPVVDQNAESIILGYHGIVDKVHRPDTQMTPQEFEKQMQELKDKGITVIGLQDLLAWKRGEKSIPPRCAVLTFDDGLKSQYEVAWPILKKFGYPFTMFIYTEGIQGEPFGGGTAMTWDMLEQMVNAGVDVEAHSATHQDLREGHVITVMEGGKRTKKKLTGAEYEQWLQNEVVGCKQVLEQKLGIKINCYAVPFGNYNDHVKEIARNAGYEAMFTAYGQPITFRSPPDALGRTFMWANKPKIFADAVATVATSSGAPGAPSVAAVSAQDLRVEPADGSTARSLPLIKANLSRIGQIDSASVQMRISGLGAVPASYDPKTGIVSYQVTQKLRDKSCSVILTAKSGDKAVQTRWTFGVEDTGAPTVTAPTATPKK
jgi:peptidoglycan/xylan/chitin deacetylase (PgdA/CDA1 family)